MIWRTGTKNPHTIYYDEGEVSIPHGFLMHPGIAKRIVAAMNVHEAGAGDATLADWQRLTEEVERLLADLETTERGLQHNRARLAAANGLLDEWLTVDAAAGNTPQRLLDRVHAHLAGQEQAPSRAGAERCRVVLGGRIEWADIERLDGILTMVFPPRAEADQRVLDAMAEFPERDLKAYANSADWNEGQCWTKPAQAELARRGLKP